MIFLNGIRREAKYEKRVKEEGKYLLTVASLARKRKNPLK